MIPNRVAHWSWIAIGLVAVACAPAVKHLAVTRPATPTANEARELFVCDNEESLLVSATFAGHGSLCATAGQPFPRPENDAFPHDQCYYWRDPAPTSQTAMPIQHAANGKIYVHAIATHDFLHRTGATDEAHITVTLAPKDIGIGLQNFSCAPDAAGWTAHGDVSGTNFAPQLTIRSFGIDEVQTDTIRPLLAAGRTLTVSFTASSGAPAVTGQLDATHPSSDAWNGLSPVGTWTAQLTGGCDDGARQALRDKFLFHIEFSCRRQ